MDNHNADPVDVLAIDLCSAIEKQPDLSVVIEALAKVSATIVSMAALNIGSSGDSAAAVAIMDRFTAIFYSGVSHGVRMLGDIAEDGGVPLQ